MLKIFRSCMLCLVCISLSACNPIDVQDYADTVPEFDLRKFFDGQLRAEGMLQDRSGMVTRRFTATLDAQWNGNTGILDEEFLFDDGEVQTRVWNLHYHGEGEYTGTAGDVVGEASGMARGSVFHWQYQLEVPYNDDTIVVSLDDWLYLVSEDALINRTTMTKFGFKVGELTIYIEKI